MLGNFYISHRFSQIITEKKDGSYWILGERILTDMVCLLHGRVDGWFNLIIQSDDILELRAVLDI